MVGNTDRLGQANLEFGVYPFLLAELFKLTLIILISKKIINLRKFI